VVPAPANAAVVEVAGPAAVALGMGHLDYHVLGAVAQHGNEAATERGHHPLAQLAVGHGLAALWIDDLLDVVILDDMRATRLMIALIDHDGAHLGHSGGVAALRAPGLLKLALDGGDRAGRLAGEEYLVDLAIFGEVNAHLGRLLPESQGVGRRGGNGG